MQGPVLSVAADPTGHHMVTTGADGQVKVWDLRTYQPLHSYFSPAPATWCDISQRGMLAVGWGRRINIWKDALTSKQQSPYMSHNLQGGQLRDFHFCPYEVGLCTYFTLLLMYDIQQNAMYPSDQSLLGSA